MRGQKTSKLALAAFSAAAFSAAAVLAMGGAAQAGGGDGYYSPSASSGERAAEERGGWMDWMDQFGGVGETIGNFFEEAAKHAYVGARGGLNVYDDSEGGTVSLSGYEPAQGEGLDLSALTRYTDDVEYGAGASLLVGFDFTGGSEHGGLRTEADFSYQYYSATRCFRGITGTESLNDTALANRDLAQTTFESRLGSICVEQDQPVWNFLFNAFYDVKLDGLARMSGGQGLGMLKGLDVNFGVGAGYLLAEEASDFDRDRLGRIVLINDALEPRYANGNLEQKSGDIAAARTTLTQARNALTAANAAAAADPDDMALQTAAAAAQTAVNNAVTGLAAVQGVADTNRDNTTVTVEKPVQSGLFVPLYAGFSYALDDMIGVPLTAELLYRYAVVAPQGFEETHSLFGGVRYHF